MLKIEQKVLPVESQKTLQALQKKIGQLSGLTERQVEAKRMWDNRTSNKTFEAIRETLTDMCKGNVRCHYCEDARAYSIEHIYPKSIYPEKAFVWENYAYVCGDCNSSKNNTFPVFTVDTEYENATSEKPLYGQTVLLNPRQDEPLDYLELDLINTFQFVESEYDIEEKDYIRARKTIEILQLNTECGNKGEILSKQRKIAFNNFKAQVLLYKSYKENNDTEGMTAVKQQIVQMDHPTVWVEMKRYFKLYPEILKEYHSDLYDVLTKAPELLDI